MGGVGTLRQARTVAGLPKSLFPPKQDLVFISHLDTIELKKMLLDVHPPILCQKWDDPSQSRNTQTHISHCIVEDRGGDILRKMENLSYKLPDPDVKLIQHSAV